MQHGNTANARRLATEVYQGPYGMQPQAITVLRSIDVEEFNQRRLVARHEFEAGQKEYYSKNFSQAAAILRSVDFALLDPKDQARFKEAGYEVLPGYLPERPAYRQAQNEGLAITETRYASLKKHADTLIQALIDRVGEAANG